MADVDDYVEEIETDELYWDDGFYDPSDWDRDRGGGEYGGFGGGGYESDDGDEYSGSDWGEGVAPSSYPEADWRAELQSPEAKRDYLERVLGVTPGDASYKNDYRYLGLIASGQRNPTGEKWTQVMHTAQINASGRERYREPTPGVSSGPKTFKSGDYITGSARWTMAEKSGKSYRSYDGGVILDERTAAIANSGDIPRAFIAAYFAGGRA